MSSIVLKSRTWKVFNVKSEIEMLFLCLRSLILRAFKMFFSSINSHLSYETFFVLLLSRPNSVTSFVSKSANLIFKAVFTALIRVSSNDWDWLFDERVKGRLRSWRTNWLVRELSVIISSWMRIWLYWSCAWSRVVLSVFTCSFVKLVAKIDSLL